MKPKKVEIGQLWLKKTTGDHLVVKSINEKKNNVRFFGTYLRLDGLRCSSENYGHLKLFLGTDGDRENCGYKLVDPIPYLPGMQFEIIKTKEIVTIKSITQDSGMPGIEWTNGDVSYLPFDENIYRRVGVPEEFENENRVILTGNINLTISISSQLKHDE